MSKLAKILNVNILFKDIFIPLALLAFYSGSFAFFVSRLLPESLNVDFAGRLFTYLLGLMVIMCLITMGRLVTRRDEKLILRGPCQKITGSDFILLLIPLSPVVQYILSNQEMLTPLDSLVVLVCFVLIAGITILAIPALLSSFSSSRILMSLGVAFTFTISSMAVLSQQFSWYKTGSMKILLPYLFLVFVAAWLILGIKNKKTVVLLITVIFFANLGFQMLSQPTVSEGGSLPTAQNELLSMIEARAPALTPNIYLLVYDSYVANETMQAYGIDNRAQEDYLQEQGFTLYPHTYSVGSDTLGSMSRVLNASTEKTGNPRRGVAGDGIVHNALQSLGYRTVGIFPYDFMFRGVGSSYDESIPEYDTPPYVHLITAILMGEFRFDIGFEEQTSDQYAEAKQRILSSTPDSPVFIYAHSALPGHSQNSGACLPDETELFEERLLKANIEMRQDIETIQENDPGAIIIVAGDHGPYLTKNCTDTKKVYEITEITRLDIQDRFGSFLAIRWPGEEYEEYDQISVLQDVFPAIFAYLYADREFLDLIKEPVITNVKSTSGATIINGIISGGVDDGEALFLSGK
jgi:hypothetical protein